MPRARDAIGPYRDVALQEYRGRLAKTQPRTREILLCAGRCCCLHLLHVHMVPLEHDAKNENQETRCETEKDWDKERVTRETEGDIQ